MSISSDEVRRAQFSGTEHSYDAREVEEFRRRVVETLALYEAERPDLSRAHEELSAAQRARHQAVELAERMLREVMGAADGDAGGLTTWQEAAMMRAAAEEELSFAAEEAKRLVAVAMAERASMRDGLAGERKQLRTELHNELQASRDAADAEVADMRAAAREEAADIVKQAVAKAEETQRSAASEAHRLERRLAVLHSALADAETRFRRLAATAANEVGTMQAIIDQDVASLPEADDSLETARDAASPRPDLYLASIDLTERGFGRPEPESEPEPAPAEPGMIHKDPEVGFYQRRLAGLRDRLEKSGHPPE